MSAATENAARLLTEAEASYRRTYGGIKTDFWRELADSWTEVARAEALEQERESAGTHE